MELKKNKTKMDEFMLQQLLGFRLGKQGYSIRELISSAGLTKKEWFNIKDETDITSLEESDIKEIEDYVNNLGVRRWLKQLILKQNGNLSGWLDLEESDIKWNAKNVRWNTPL